MLSKSNESLTYSMRKELIQLAYACGKPTHLGGALSIVDILAAILEVVYQEGDDFILSKGHGVMAYYVFLEQKKRISKEMLNTFEQNDSKLSVLAVRTPELGIHCSTGSLGQGIGVAVGMALAKKKRNEDGKVYVLIGNGEANEGSVWEAAMLAVQHNLENLIVIQDNNGYQSDGDSSHIIDMKNSKTIWEGYGFETVCADGHNVEKIVEAVHGFQEKGKPKAIVCHTMKGYGVSFMESDADWHHNRLTRSGYELALKELETRFGVEM